MLNQTIERPAEKVDKPLVLVVDDEYGPREAVAFTLSADFNVEVAERASEALSKIKERTYSVVIMDIRMPEMDGVRALEELRKIDSCVSVIMLTGYGTLLTAQQSMVAGANQYLRKPPDILELIEAVKKQAEASKLRRHNAKLVDESVNLNIALKGEIERNEPQIWQARASVELVHDLNNPLTVVIGYAALLAAEAKGVAAKDAALAQKLTDYANMVEKAAEYCHHLSENWRMASKKVMEFSRLDLLQVAHEVKQVIFFGNPAIQFKGLESAVIRGSKYEIMRVLQNLWKNGLEAHATRVEVEFTKKGDKFEVSVSDNGSGMSPQDVKKALRGGYSSKESGTGLGLSICRHLLGSHGGSFSMESTLGKGTTARLVFPVAAGE